MADLVTFIAFFKELRAAGGADVGFITRGIGVFDLAESAERPAGPIDEPHRAATNGIVANGTFETLVGFAMLLEEPIFFRKSDQPEQRDENPNDNDDRQQDEDVFEIA